MAKKALHNPLTISLFAAGLVAETVLSSHAGEVLILNSLVVFGTAVYFYIMDDVERIIRKIFE